MIWYRVRDLDAARAFYMGKLGFTEIDFHAADGWITLAKGKSTLGLAQGEPQQDQAVVMVDIGDVKAEAERLRGEEVEVGTVLELHGAMRIVDVFDPDGNRLQLGQEIG